MNRFYIEAKLHTDLKTELLKVFTSIVADQHVSRLIPLMVTAQSKPFCIPPAVMSTMCKHLYQLNPDYTVIEPKLFSSYLPNVLPQMTEEDLQVTPWNSVNNRTCHNSVFLQAQKDADRLLQESLRSQGWGCNENMSHTRKRDLEEVPGPPNRG